MSCDGYKYTLSPNTLAVGSAEYMFVMSGFWANEFVANPIKQERKKYLFFKFILLLLKLISKLLLIQNAFRRYLFVYWQKSLSKIIVYFPFASAPAAFAKKI